MLSCIIAPPPPPLRGRIRRRRRCQIRNQVLVVAAIAAASRPIGSDAAFSSRLAGALSRQPIRQVQRSGSSVCSSDNRARGPLHHGPSSLSMSSVMLEALICDSSDQAPTSPFGGTRPSNDFVKGQYELGSLSGQYGGLGSGINSATDADGSSEDNHIVDDEGNVLGFRVEDFQRLAERQRQSSLEESQLRKRRQMIEVQKDGIPLVRTFDPRIASHIKKRVAASVLGEEQQSIGMELATLQKKKEVNGVPPWFPWLPTESQINSLKVIELRAACVERGLVTTGRKAQLQQRLLEWATLQDRQRVKDRLTGLKDLIETSKNKETIEIDPLQYDVDFLTNKRKALTKEKRLTKPKKGILGLVDQSFFTNSTESTASTSEEESDDLAFETPPSSESYLNNLSRTFNAPASRYTNRQVRQMYMEAKSADQAGDRLTSKMLLSQLRTATPHDMRVVRRLARMEQEDGNLSTARRILQQALRLEPDNAHLLHGLGHLEKQAGNDSVAINYFRQAVDKNPNFPNPYHALGTLEHTHGNIKSALSVIKTGLKACPKNHRLHHALGDIYLDAKMLELAEDSYLAGLKLGPEWSKPFVYTSLSFVSYEKGHVRDCRTLLCQSLEINGGMHAQGVIALAQLEESEGNINEARKVYRDAILNYEKRRRKRSPFRPKPLGKNDNVFNTSFLVDGPGNQYTRSYAGDKWINVFKSWAGLEEIHGTYETAHIVFSKAARLFPNSSSLMIKWAQLQVDHDDKEKARLLFKAACHRVGDRSADPYRLFAEFEMKQKNFVEAQSILFRGAQIVSESSGSNVDSKSGLALLFHTWGVCEYHLGNEARAELLFDDALRVTGSGEADSAIRSLILYSMAKLEYSRKEYLLAQHCIGLSLKENLLPGGNSLIWKLWSSVAKKMDNEELAERCKEQSMARREEELGGTVSDLSRMLGERDTKSSERLPERMGPAMKDMFRKSPWYNLVCPPRGRVDKNWYNGAELWTLNKKI